jgi:hypothetical protein
MEDEDWPKLRAQTEEVEVLLVEVKRRIGSA